MKSSLQTNPIKIPAQILTKMALQLTDKYRIAAGEKYES